MVNKLGKGYVTITLKSGAEMTVPFIKYVIVTGIDSATIVHKYGKMRIEQDEYLVHLIIRHCEKNKIGIIRKVNNV